VLSLLSDLDTECRYGAIETETAEAIKVGQSSAEIKAGFIGKVYSILAIQLLVTASGAALCMFDRAARVFVLSTPAMMYLALFAPIGLIFALHCYKDRHPVNMYLLGAFTLCEGYTVGVICAVYYEQGAGLIVLQALLLTAAVFISLTTYVLVTRKDFSWLGAGLFTALIVLLVWGVFAQFFSFGLGGRMLFSLLGALLFSGYILYDTSNLLHRLGPDDYIVAAISLFLDIINLFLNLLQLLRGLQSN